LKLKAACSFRFTCKHIAVNTCYILPDVLEGFQTAIVTVKVT